MNLEHTARNLLWRYTFAQPKMFNSFSCLADWMFRHYFQRSQYKNSAAHVHLPVEGLQYICSICNKAIVTHTGFQEHMNMHKGIYRYQCTMCQKGFSSSVGFHDHMRRHTGERFACEGCRRQFISKKGYMDHRKICDKGVRPVSTNW